MKFLKSKKQGFTLIELALVLSISTIIGMVTFSQILKNTENNKAMIAGEQIKLIGEATNAYISNHYDTLSTLTSSTGTTEDLGPRTCSTSTNTCTITTKTLSNEGLLPSTYSGTNVYGSGYTITLKRTGTSPYYKIYGLITTSDSLNIGGNIRYDLLGQAMLAAGIDSGITQQSSSKVSGYNGSWSASNLDYSNINKLGQLAYQAGYGTYDYSVFLRRDGTLPMTGNLNMDSNDIVNAKNITASGTTTATTLKSTNDTNVGNDLTVTGTGSFGGNLAVAGMSNLDQPSNYLGGVISPDYYGNGGLYIAKTGSSISSKNWAIQADNNGLLQTTGNITAGNNVTAGNWIIAHNQAGNTISIGGDSLPGTDISEGADYEIKMDTAKRLTLWNSATNSDRSKTMFDVWGTQNISGNLTVSNANNADGSISATGNITSNGTVSGDTLLPSSTSTLGSSCATVGLISKTSDGTPLYCINGYWSNIPVDKSNQNGGMLLPNGMKIMWGKLSAPTLASMYDSNTGIYESYTNYYEPSFTANGKTYTFNTILNVQYTVTDVGGVGQQEQMWGAYSGSNLMYQFATKEVTTMTGYYYAIGY